MTGRAHPASRWTWVTNRWIGALFAIGSLCFAVGVVPAYASAVGTVADAATFFVGSVFFTSAGALQFLQAVNVPLSAGGTAAAPEWIQTTSLVWWATAVQLVGTVFFNVNTLRSLRLALGSELAARVVWRPDALGSICFLVASVAALIPVDHRPGRDRRIATVNLVGSVAFGFSAAGAFTLSTGSTLNANMANAGTFFGAICFLLGAIALMRPAPPDATVTADQGAVTGGL